MTSNQTASVSVSASHSVADAVTNQTRRKIISGTYSKLDYLFPVYHIITQDIELPRFLYYISITYNIIQFLVTSLWILMNQAFHIGEKIGIVHDYLAKIAFFISGNENQKYRMIIFCIFSAIFGLNLLFVVFQYTSYKRSRSFKKWALYINRFFIDFLVPISILPMSQFLGYVTLLVVENANDTVDLVYLILTIIYILALYMLIYFSQLLISASPFLPMHDLGTWSTPVLVKMYFVTTVFLFFGGFVRVFQNWLKSFLIFLHIALIGLFLFEIYNFPFISLTLTKLLTSTLTGMIFGDLMAFFYTLYPKFDYFMIIIIEVIFFFINLIVVVAVIKKYKKKVTKTLNDPETNDDVYYHCGLVQHPQKAVFYLHVGFTDMCDRFLDWSLVKFLANNSQSTNVLLECIRIVAFFPPESRLLNMLFTSGVSKHDLKVQHRFTLFQIEKIKSIRQSSSSADVTEQLNKMVTMTNICINECCSFWNNVPNNDTVFQYIAELIKNAQIRWTECLRSYPNNYRYREEYAKFLIDCKADFSNGVMQKYHSNLIDQGFSFAKDRAFRNMLMNYPLYLKRNILDLKGNITKFRSHHARKGSQSSSSSSNQGSNTVSSSCSTIDMEVQEALARSLFRHARMRIAMQTAVDDRSSNVLTMMHTYAFITLVIQIVCAIAIEYLLRDMYSPRLANIQRTNSLNNLRSTVSYSEIVSHIRWAQQRKAISNDQILTNMCKDDGIYSILEMDLKIYQKMAADAIIPVIETLMYEIATLAENGDDIYSAAITFVDSVVNINIASNKRIIGPSSTTLQTIVASMYSNLLQLSEEEIDGQPDWSENDQYLQYISNLDYVANAFDLSYQSFINKENSLVKANQKLHNLYMLAFPITLFALTALWTLIEFLLFKREQKKLLNLLKTVEDQARDEASHSMVHSSIDGAEEGPHSGTPMDGRTNKIYLYGFLIFILLTLYAALIFLNIYMSLSLNTTFRTYNGWVFFAGARTSMLYEGLGAVTLGLLIAPRNGLKNFTVTSFVKQLDRAFQQFEKAISYNIALLSGDKAYDTPPCRGSNDDLDEIQLASHCTTDMNTSIHELIKCSSLTENFELVSSLYTKVASVIITQNGISDENYFLLFHAVIDHMSEEMKRSRLILYSIAEKAEEKHRSTMIIFMVIEIIAAILIVFITLAVVSFFQNVFNAALSLLKRIPPLILVSNSELLDYVLARKVTKGNDEMETGRSVIHNSQDAIICVSKVEIIEIVNAGVPQLLGYTPEQLLGQPLNVVLAEESVEVVDKQLSMMRQGQDSLTYDGHVKCLTDDDQSIACHIIIIGMDEDGHGAANSFVVILRGEEALLKQQEEAEEAKKQSENLLFHILPKDIVFRLNRGENNISFAVPSASIIFIDIQRFSEYSASLTPTQIMGHLSMLFEAFDKAISNYPLMIKIKLIGDIYMAAAGLFTPDEPPAHHAEQTVRFALEALNELDEVNVKLSSSLQVRIGINSGGPLIAGVLGTDKPVFDIIGDPINVAARLQSTDIAGRIQISTGTYELISHLDFNIEKRGEVFLKGKGKQISYLVSQSAGTSIGIAENSSFNSPFVMNSADMIHAQTSQTFLPGTARSVIETARSISQE
ncbi:Adenylate and Guanylate cyclase catalytic domain containing protein [Tritrichomonas foetus]|uniref:Adenylate and Guanylate cyclase catalytic domain containing protein n=1 Tax=Tritrichomonas foetus TaxID=1144522 RepID=A0A1J4JXX5_9EUKA|nr:Adenylate and Guanylate cyclase catalytic domain containing protein [Tritrichomonas foetus]|eukprot:OHT03304.1 Adenylate and Guanylate cyclase catalytic domain containing protein [Tritrichomonas foetus]